MEDVNKSYECGCGVRAHVDTEECEGCGADWNYMELTQCERCSLYGYGDDFDQDGNCPRCQDEILEEV